MGQVWYALYEYLLDKMSIIIIIFFISIILAFGMLTFRAWEIRTARVSIPDNKDGVLPNISFRHVEKSMLYLTKHVIQGLILTCVKYWYIFITKTKKWVSEKWPKIHSYFEKKESVSLEPSKPSFLEKAILESKAKIKRIKEKVKREHE